MNPLILTDTQISKIREFEAVGPNYKPQSFSGLFDAFRKKNKLPFINFSHWLKTEQHINIYDIFIDHILQTKKLSSNDLIILLDISLKYSTYDLKYVEPIVFNYLNTISESNGVEAKTLFKIYKKYKNLDEDKLSVVLNFLTKWNNYQPFDHLKQDEIKSYLDSQNPDVVKIHANTINTLLTSYDKDSLIENSVGYSYSIKIDGNKIGRVVGTSFNIINNSFSSNLSDITKNLNHSFYIHNTPFKIKNYRYSRDIKNIIEGDFIFDSEQERDVFKEIFPAIIDNLIIQFKNKDSFNLKYHIKSVEQSQLLKLTEQLTNQQHKKIKL